MIYMNELKHNVHIGEWKEIKARVGTQLPFNRKFARTLTKLKNETG